MGAPLFVTDFARHHLRPLPPVEPDDAEVLRRAASGDRVAFTSIYRANGRYVAGVVYRLLGSSADVDDVVQDTFVAAHRGLQQIEDPRALRRWLVTIAVRQVQRRLGLGSRKRRLEEALVHHFEEVTDPALARRLEDLYEALDALDVSLRVPWILARLEGHSLGDVAAECEVSLATVKRRIATAEQRIAKRLSRG